MDFVVNGDLDSWFGRAYLHPADHFVKKFGRCQALQNMLDIMLKEKVITPSTECEILVGYHLRNKKKEIFNPRINCSDVLTAAKNV